LPVPVVLPVPVPVVLPVPVPVLPVPVLPVPVLPVPSRGSVPPGGVFATVSCVFAHSSSSLIFCSISARFSGLSGLTVS